MPGEFLLTQAACTAYGLKLLYLNKLPLRRKGIVLAQPKSIRRRLFVFSKSQEKCMGKLGGEMKALAKHWR